MFVIFSFVSHNGVLFCELKNPTIMQGLRIFEEKRTFSSKFTLWVNDVVRYAFGQLYSIHFAKNTRAEHSRYR